jgi:hypothetical protein
MTPKVLASGAVVVALLATRVADAQTAGGGDSPGWLRDRRYTEGIGIRTGDLELHPGLAGEVGYDSNWMLRTDRASCVDNTGATPVARPCDNGPPLSRVIPSLEFRITPSLYLSTLGAQRREEDVGAAQPSIAFRAGVNATWRAFVGLANNGVGSNDIGQQTSGIPSFAADARLTILPGRPVGGAVFVSGLRDQRPNQTTTDPNLSFSSDNVGGGGELVLQPGSGTLDWHFGYQYRAVLFEASPSQALNNGTHELFTRGRWRFRPRTALLYDATIRFISYNDSNLAAQQGLVGSTPVRTRIGLNGLISERFAALVLVGWAASLYDTSTVAQQPQYDTVIGQAELTWFLTPAPGIGVARDLTLSLSSVSLGYNRDFQNSYLGNYYGSDRGYLRFAYFFAGRALINLEGGVGALEYPTMYWSPMVPRHPAFTDIRADATLFAEYRFSDSVGLNTTVRYTANFSNTHDMPDQPPSTGVHGVFDMAWTRFEAFLGLRWFL